MTRNRKAELAAMVTRDGVLVALVVYQLYYLVSWAL